MTLPIWFPYAVASGWDNAAGLINFETYFVNPLRANRRIPRGAQSELSLDGWRTTDGAQDVELVQEWTFFSYLTAYVDAIFGDWDGEETAEVTLRFRKVDGTFEDYNAYAYLPIENEHYRHITTSELQDIRLPFRIIEEAS